MAEFVKERAEKLKPIVSIPRGRLLPGTPKILEIYIQIGKKPAGCVVCQNVIPPDSSRLKMLVRFPTEWIKEGTSKSVQTQSYYLHPGCITDRIKPEIIRFGLDCFDCGDWPPELDSGNLNRYGEHRYRCFTVSKFAPAHICSKCIKKPRWKCCEFCEVFFPHWMISKVCEKSNLKTSDPFNTEDIEIVGRSGICEFCAKRYDILTEEIAAESRNEFERLRREILEQGIYGDM